MSILKKLVPGAYATNSIKLHESSTGCCGTSKVIKKYERLGAYVANVTTVVVEIDGSNHTLSFAAATSYKDLRLKLAAALLAHGYDPYFQDMFKSITVTATEFSVIGELKFVSFTGDSGPHSFVEKATLGRVCKVTGEIPFDTDLGFLSTDGTAGTQVGTVAGYASSNAAGLITGLGTALTAESVTYKKVEVITGTTKFMYTIHLITDTNIYLGTDMLPSAGCYTDFVS